MSQLQSFPLARQILRVSKKQAVIDLNSLTQSSIGLSLITLYEEKLAAGPTLKEIEEAISQDFVVLNQLIQEAQERFEVRLHRLEGMMVNIVTEELQQMRRQIKTLSQELSYKIALNDENEEITYLRNQLDYFKFEALKLFQENKQMRIQVKLLKKTLSEYEISLEAEHEALKKSKKREFKQRMRQKMDGFENSPLREYLNGDKNKIFKIAKTKNGKTEDTEFRLKTQIGSIQQESRNKTRPISKSLNQNNIYSTTLYPRSSKPTNSGANRHQPINKYVINQSFAATKVRNSLIVKNLDQIMHPVPQTSQMLQNRVRKMRMKQQNQRYPSKNINAHNRTYTEGGNEKGFFHIELVNLDNQHKAKNDNNTHGKGQLFSHQITRKHSFNSKIIDKSREQNLIYRKNEN